MEKLRPPHYVVELAPKLRGGQTTGKETLWRCLRDRRLAGAKFRRQHPLGRYIADFYCHEAHLVIELEGSIHETEDSLQYDEIRRETIEAQGVKVLRFRNEELVQDLDGVLSTLVGALSTPK